MAKASATITFQSGSDSTLYAAFSVPGTAKDGTPLGSHATEWYYQWRYRFADVEGWFYPDGSSKKKAKKTKYAYTTYSPPNGFWQVGLRLKATPGTYKKSGKKHKYFTSEWSDWITFDSPGGFPFPEVGAPNVEFQNGDNTKLIASLEWHNTTKLSAVMQYHLVDTDLFEENSNSGVYALATINEVDLSSVIFDLAVGHKYRVRARAVHTPDGTVATVPDYFGDWSNLSSEIVALPDTPTNVRAIADTSTGSKTTARLTWTPGAGAESHNIEYTQSIEDFDVNPDKVNSTSTEYTGGALVINNLDTGGTYYFRISAVNGTGKSGWSEIATVTVGTKPEPPTTWSIVSTVSVGTPINLYWVHNSKDQSSQTYANLQLDVNGSIQTINIKNTEDPEHKDDTSKYELNTAVYSDGATIKWRVQTKGAFDEYGDWSAWRTITIRANATVAFTKTPSSVISSYPLEFKVRSGPATQRALRYYGNIISTEDYITENEDGSYRHVNVGDSVYTSFIDGGNTAEWNIGPGDVMLENGVTYIFKAFVVMDSGLNAECEYTFRVSWAYSDLQLDAEMAYNEDDYSMYITPYCNDNAGNPVNNALLSVWRANYDGTFTLIEKDIPSGMNVTVNDPHPALNYAKYRISARLNNGLVDFADLPEEEVGVKSIVIQWDEMWNDFSTDSEDEIDNDIWNGSRLVLPFDIDVSNDYAPDVSLVEYAGRRHPVSYYGTQRGETASYQVDIIKSDTETLEMLRRLANYPGDVYVREPSGTGYWANVTVSISITHCELTIPVTITVNRVEGGA